jgi:hypothetical protein
MFLEHRFESMPHNLFIKHVQGKLEEIVKQAQELDRPVTFRYPSLFKNKQVIQLHNICNKYKLECISKYVEQSEMDHEKDFNGVNSIEKLLSSKGKKGVRKVLIVTAIPSVSIVPVKGGEKVQLNRDIVVANKQIRKNQIKEDQEINIVLMDDAEFSKFLEIKLSQLVGLCDAEENPTVSYTFPPMNGERRSILHAVCARCFIGIENETKSTTRLEKNQALIDINQGIFNNGLGCKVTVAYSISKKPKRHFIRSIAEKQKARNTSTGSFASGSASDKKISIRRDKKQKFRKKKTNGEHVVTYQTPQFDFSHLFQNS